MAVYLAAIVVATFYTAAIPIKFAAILKISAKIGFGAGLAPFENRFARRSALRRTFARKKAFSWKNFSMNAKKRAMLQAARRGAQYLVKHMHFEQFRASGVVCTSDAAHTAMICGFANSIGETLRPMVRCGEISIRLDPEFSGKDSRVEICGMISLRLGHIIFAAILAIMEYGNGRMHQWTSTRLKTS